MQHLLTIGYGNAGWAQVERLLWPYRGAVIFDVRSVPRSARHPEFEKAALERSLPAIGLAYAFMGNELGARPSDPTVYQAGRLRYDLLERSVYFRAGMDHLNETLHTCNVVLLCSEADPINCHRAILIGRLSLRHGFEARHISHSGGSESQRQLESRLLQAFGLYSDTLFSEQEDRERLVQQAYAIKEDQIAYQLKADVEWGLH